MNVYQQWMVSSDTMLHAPVPRQHEGTYILHSRQNKTHCSSIITCSHSSSRTGNGMHKFPGKNTLEYNVITRSRMYITACLCAGRMCTPSWIQASKCGELPGSQQCGRSTGNGMNARGNEMGQVTCWHYAINIWDKGRQPLEMTQ